MPLEIRELVIRATVEDKKKRHAQEIDLEKIKQELFQEMEYLVERVMRKQQER